MVTFSSGAYFWRLYRVNETKANLDFLHLEARHLNEPKLKRYWFKIILMALGDLRKIPGNKENSNAF